MLMREDIAEGAYLKQTNERYGIPAGIIGVVHRVGTDWTGEWCFQLRYLNRRARHGTSTWSLNYWENDLHACDFKALMKRRQDVRYVAFDLLWLNETDLSRLPLLTRKAKLKQILPRRSEHVLYVDHAKGSGKKLFALACELDLEGIIAKNADSPYDPTSTQPYWIKIKNPAYSQKEGRGDLFRKPA